jgi:hypothetical protein
LGAAVIGLSAGYFWPLKRETAARAFDRIFELQERVSTALELDQNKQQSRVPEELVRRQLQDTIEHAHSVDPNKRLRLSLDRKPLILTVVLILGIALVGLQGEQFFQAAQGRRVVQQAIEQEIEDIEALQGQIESDPNLSPEQKEELLKPLEDAKEGLENSENAEQAVSVLTSTQERLAALDNAAEQKQALQEIGKALSQEEGSPLQEVSESLEAGDALTAAQELANIDAANLSQEEQQELAEQLREAAEALDSVNSELAEQLESAAQALQAGDAQAANQALDQAAQSLTEAGQQIAQSEAASQAAAQMGDGKDQILQAGQNASGQPTGSGQTGQTPGSSTGQGQSQNNHGGSGAGRGEGSSDSQGPEADSDPIEQGNGPGDGGESAYEQIYAPTRLGGESDEQVTLPESGELGEEIIGSGDTAPGETESSSVPYVDVYAYYAEFYRQAINSGQIPEAYSELVRQYFLSLEP